MSSIVRKATKEEALRLEKAFDALHAAAVKVCEEENLSAGELITSLLDLLSKMCEIADVSEADLISLLRKTTQFNLPDISDKSPHTMN